MIYELEKLTKKQGIEQLQNNGRPVRFIQSIITDTNRITFDDILKRLDYCIANGSDLGLNGRTIKVVKSNHLVWSNGSRLDLDGAKFYRYGNFICVKYDLQKCCEGDSDLNVILYNLQ